MTRTKLAEELVKLAEGILKQSKKYLDFEYAIEGKLYHVEISAYDSKNWVIEDITVYRKDSDVTDSLSEIEFKRLKSIFENSDEFIDVVLEEYFMKYPKRR